MCPGTGRPLGSGREAAREAGMSGLSGPPGAGGRPELPPGLRVRWYLTDSKKPPAQRVPTFDLGCVLGVDVPKPHFFFVFKFYLYRHFFLRDNLEQ